MHCSKIPASKNTERTTKNIAYIGAVDLSSHCDYIIEHYSLFIDVSNRFCA